MVRFRTLSYILIGSGTFLIRFKLNIILYLLSIQICMIFFLNNSIMFNKNDTFYP